MGEHYRPDESESYDREWEFGELPKTDSLFDDCTNNVSVVKVSTLNFVDVTVSGVSSKALCDSGAQIPVVSTDVLSNSATVMLLAVCVYRVSLVNLSMLRWLSIKLNDEK